MSLVEVLQFTKAAADLPTDDAARRPVCFWEDDPHQSQDPTFVLGANGTSLVEAQRTYLRIGAMHPVFVKKVRRPRRLRDRDPNWQSVSDRRMLAATHQPPGRRRTQG
jgi:hypothetical protein